MSQLLTDNAEIFEVCERLSHEAFVTVDTEFVREKTYWPKLCLVQLGGTHEAVAIDPLAPDVDLSPLWELMLNDKVRKVFHACGQDMEIFVHEMDDVPRNVYDTQIAAMVCGFGEQVGYEALVTQLVGAQLDKASRYTDWAERPLRQRQLDYAISDVTHLRDIYVQLEERLDEEGRKDWIADDMAAIIDRTRYEKDPMECWQKLKLRNRKPAFLNRVRAVAAWRETIAQTKNRPRHWIMKDEIVSEVAHYNPTTEDELKELRGIGNNLNDKDTHTLLEALAEANSVPKEDWPKMPKPIPPTPAVSALIDVLKLLMRQQCLEHDIVPKLLTDKDELRALAEGSLDKTAPILNGWRYDLFGQHAKAFVEGNMVLKGDPQKGLVFAES